jgi:hypothetical protein
MIVQKSTKNGMKEEVVADQKQNHPPGCSQEGEVVFATGMDLKT